MKKLLIVAVMAIMVDFAAVANQLDDIFAKIMNIEGVVPIEVPEEECAKEGFDSGWMAMLGSDEQCKAVDALVATIDEDLQILSVSKDAGKVFAWLLVEGDDDATLLMSVSAEGNNMVIFIKGSKDIVNGIQITE